MSFSKYHRISLRNAFERLRPRQNPGKTNRIKEKTI
jgi:hypothetical protein